MRTLAVHTLGCKINQFDSAAIAEAATGAGYRVVGAADRADVLVVNTCTVTHTADGQGRQLARRLRRKNPGATIVVTGCYAQVSPEEVARVDGVDVVLGTLEKDALTEVLADREARGDADGPVVRVGSMAERRTLALPDVDGFGDRTRAFLKVQDGCNARCAFCIIPAARGRSRSAPVEEVLDRVQAYERAGYPEIVLAGVHLGAYGRDLRPRSTLAGLLRALLAETEIPRIRVSSVEPTHATDELLDFLAAEPRICPHVHLPLQSGSDAVLRRMRRGYTTGRYLERVARVLDRQPHAALGLDVIAGFPGETDAEFAETLAFLEALPAAYFHVFPYSPREGTPAHAARDVWVHPAVVKERAAALRAVGEENRAAFHAAQVGRALRVVVERPIEDRPGWVQGASRAYVPVALRGEADLVGREVTVRGAAVADGWVLATHEGQRVDVLGEWRRSERSTTCAPVELLPLAAGGA